MWPGPARARRCRPRGESGVRLSSRCHKLGKSPAAHCCLLSDLGANTQRKGLESACLGSGMRRANLVLVGFATNLFQVYTGRPLVRT